MAFLGKHTNVSIKLNGRNLNPPKEWEDITVLATFDEEVQPNITTEEFTFILDAYTEIKNHIALGVNSDKGIFEGVPFDIEAFNNTGSISAFKGFVDLSEGAEINDTLKQISARVKKSNGLNSLSDRLESIDWGFLESEGAVSDSSYVNVEYIVQPKDETLDAIISVVIIFIMSKELYDSILTLAKDIATTSGISSSATTGTLGAAVFQILSILANIAYIAALIIVITQLAIDFILKYGGIKRTHKAIRLSKMMTIISEYLGYGFNSSIDDLDNFVSLPSNNNTDSYDDRGFLKIPGTIKKGYPNSTDPGYTGLETFEIIREMFNARYAIIDGVIELHEVDSDYWIRKSTYAKPPVLKGNYTYNTEDLKSNVLINFNTDITDIYTVDNFTGTNYQVITTPLKTTSDYNSIKGLDRVNIPYALGNRKNELSGAENTILEVAKTIDTLTSSSFFGKRTNFASQIRGKKGMLIVSQNNHSVPKLLYMPGSRIPSNHRDELSAKALWDNYHNEKSFIFDNFKKQRKVFTGEQIPFGFDDFSKLIKNSYFRENGKLSKVTKLEWNMSNDTAVIDYWQQEIYTKNLKETFVEP